MMKNPLPWMAKSVFRPVACSEPCVCRTSMPPIFMPRPTCCGFVPPRLSVGAEAPEIVWVSMSWKVTRLALKPCVLTFAMLLPTTSMYVMWFCRPAMAANNAFIMMTSPVLPGAFPGRRQRPGATSLSSWPPPFEGDHWLPCSDDPLEQVQPSGVAVSATQRVGALRHSELRPTGRSRPSRCS